LRPPAERPSVTTPLGALPGVDHAPDGARRALRALEARTEIAHRPPLMITIDTVSGL
jgi:hypothetical protein